MSHNLILFETKQDLPRIKLLACELFVSTVLIKFQYRNNRRQTRLFHSLSISLQYLIKKLANGESTPAKPRNPSGLYVSALSIATWLLPVMAQQTTKKPRCEAAKRRSKEEKAEEYLTNEALAVGMSMAYDYVTPSKPR